MKIMSTKLAPVVATADAYSSTIEDEVRAELKAMLKITRVMSKLSKADRARVLLVAITKYAPNTFTDTQLLALVRQAQGPST